MDYRIYNQKLFKKTIGIYDCSEILLAHVRKHIAQNLHFPQKASIIDIACGTGNQSIALAKEGYMVTGVDLSPEMLEKAKKKAKNIPNVAFYLADATQLPFEDNSFDLSIITFSLHDMAREIGVKVIHEMQRVTKKHGQLLILDYTVSKRKTLFEKGAYYIPQIWESKYYCDYHTHDISLYLEANNITDYQKESYLAGIANLITASNSSQHS